MIKITVVTVGTLKEKYLKEGIAEYLKRLSKFATIDIKNVADEPINDGGNFKEKESVKNKEGEKILKIMDQKSYKIALDVIGTEVSSEEFSAKISDVIDHENSAITFIIGGSLGLAKNVLDAMDFRLSFSKMTFPHQLMQLIFLEQLYRAFKIIRHETYHK